MNYIIHIYKVYLEDHFCVPKKKVAAISHNKTAADGSGKYGWQRLVAATSGSKDVLTQWWRNIGYW